MAEIIIRHADGQGWSCSNTAENDVESHMSEDGKSLQVRNMIRVRNLYTVQGVLQVGDSVNIAIRTLGAEQYHNCIVRVLSQSLCKLEITQQQTIKSQVIYGD